MSGSEVGLILNEGLISATQSLLRLIGPPDVVKINHDSIMLSRRSHLGAQGVSAIFEDMLQRSKRAPMPLSGPELARMMTVGARVVRGVDWKWGDQDGPHTSEGNIVN